MTVAIPKLKIAEVIDEIEQIYTQLTETGVIDISTQRIDELLYIAKKMPIPEPQAQAMTFYALALLYTLKNDKVNAKFNHQKLIKLCPQDPIHIYNYSVSLWLLGEIKQAISCLQEAAKLPLHLDMEVRILCNFTRFFQLSEANQMLKHIVEQHTDAELAPYLGLLAQNKMLNDKYREFGLDEKLLTQLLTSVFSHFRSIFPFGASGVHHYYNEHADMIVYEIIGNSTQDEAFEIDLQLVDFISRFEVEHNVNFPRFLLMYKGVKQ